MLSKIKEYYMAKILLFLFVLYGKQIEIFLTSYFKFILFKFMLIFPYNKINREKSIQHIENTKLY